MVTSAEGLLWLQGCIEAEHEQLLERRACEAANGHEAADGLQRAVSAAAGRFGGVRGTGARGPGQYKRASHAVNEHKWGNAGWAEPWIVPSEGRLGRYGLTSSFKHGYSWFEWQASPIRKPSGSKCVEKDCWSGEGIHLLSVTTTRASLLYHRMTRNHLQRFIGKSLACNKNPESILDA